MQRPWGAGAPGFLCICQRRQGGWVGGVLLEPPALMRFCPVFLPQLTLCLPRMAWGGGRGAQGCLLVERLLSRAPVPSSHPEGVCTGWGPADRLQAGLGCGSVSPRHFIPYSVTFF